MNQLYLDLARTKALCIAEGVGQHSYCSCLVGKVARALGCTDVMPLRLNMTPLDVTLWARFRTVLDALAAEAPGSEDLATSSHGFLLTWNDRMDRGVLTTAVLDLIDRAAARASS